MTNDISTLPIDSAAMEALSRALAQLGGTSAASIEAVAPMTAGLSMGSEAPIVLYLNGREVGRALRDDTYEAQQGLDKRLRLGVGR